MLFRINRALYRWSTEANRLVDPSILHRTEDRIERMNRDRSTLSGMCRDHQLGVILHKLSESVLVRLPNILGYWLGTASTSSEPSSTKFLGSIGAVDNEMEMMVVTIRLPIESTLHLADRSEGMVMASYRSLYCARCSDHAIDGTPELITRNVPLRERDKVSVFPRRDLWPIGVECFGSANASTRYAKPIGTVSSM